MSDSALRRPLLWLLAAYMGVLALLHARGAFAPVVAPEDLPLHRSEATVIARQLGPAREDQRGWKSELEGVEAFGAPLPYRLQGRWPKGAQLADLPLPGDRVLLRGWLRLPRPARNPGDFDEAAFLADRGLAWVLEGEDFTIIEDRIPLRFFMPRIGERLRRSARRALWAALPPDRARLAEGLLLGYKGALEPSLARAVRDAGLIHLIVPSGAKVAVCLALAAALAAALRLPPWSRLALGALLGGAVTLAAGAEPPYVRALCAALIVGVARAAGRESDAFQALVISAWLQLLAEPRTLFSMGFQMTYLALAGILALLPVLEQALRGRRLRAPLLALGIAAVVQAALLPIFACGFGLASAAGLLSNALVTPLYPVAAGAGWAVWAASFAGERAAVLAAVPLSWTLAAFEALCARAAALPWAAVPLAPWSWTSCAAYGMALLSLGRLRRPLGRLMLAAALALWAGGKTVRRLERPPLRVVFLKAPPKGGRARRPALLLTAEGRAFLIGDAPPALLRRALLALDVPRLDAVWPCGRRAGARLGRVAVGFCPPRLMVGGSENAMIARLRLSSLEVATDGVEVHEGFPR